MSQTHRKSDEKAAELDLGGLQRSVGYAVRRAQIAIFQDFYRTLASLDLTPAVYSVLLVIARNPGSRQRQVSEALGIQASNFTVLAAQLEERGWLDRRPNPLDRRTVALHLTGQGEDLLRRAEHLVAHHERAVTASLSEADLAQLLALLERLLAQGCVPSCN